MISIFETLNKRKYGNYPEIKLPENVSNNTLRAIQSYIALFKNAKVAADSKEVEKEHLQQ